MSKIIIGAVIAIVLFLSGLMIGRYVFYKTEIKVEEVKVEDTIWKDKYNQLQKKVVSMPKQITQADKEKITDDDLSDLIFCYNASLDFEDHTENNILFVTAFTPCKEATAEYKIGVRNNYAVYLTIGLVGIGTGLALYHFMR
jgi:hypothetical protein